MMIGEATRAAPPSTNAGFRKCEAIQVSIDDLFQPRNTRNTRKRWDCPMAPSV
jgi:hypothetical protein